MNFAAGALWRRPLLKRPDELVPYTKVCSGIIVGFVSNRVLSCKSWSRTTSYQMMCPHIVGADRYNSCNLKCHRWRKLFEEESSSIPSEERQTNIALTIVRIILSRGYWEGGK